MSSVRQGKEIDGLKVDQAKRLEYLSETIKTG